MRPCFIACGLGLVLPIYAQLNVQPCLTTVILPFITVSDTHDGFQNEYTRTYQEFYSEGLREKTYTITQTCSDIDCQPPPIETAPPPGFTAAVVKCSSCGGPGLQAATLTFPTQSIEAYSSSGYVIVPISSTQPTQDLVDQNGDQSYQTPSDNGDSSPSAVALSGTNQENDSTNHSESHFGDSSDQSGSGSGSLGGLDIQNKQHGQDESDSSDSQQSGSYGGSYEGGSYGGGSENQQGDDSSSKGDSNQPGSNDGGSDRGNGSSNDQAASGLGGTNSEKQWNSTETVSGPEPVSETSTAGDDSGSSSSSSSSAQDIVHDSPDGALDTPDASNDTSPSYQDGAGASDAASLGGEHSDTSSNHTSDASSSDDSSGGSSGNTSGASNDTFDSPGNDTPGHSDGDTTGSSGNNTPGSSGDDTPGSSGSDSSSSQDDSSSKENGIPADLADDPDAPDAPPIVSSANSTQTNIFACIMATIASIFITSLPALV
ncbi:hypothetical protein FSARC_1968 [Fusarium sarcochroum]|uniref:Uncharacterized protein n=1 Tax=Fusarium sarcochroum TaxID=1208366 RepID=A0A8H4XE84_9HYPO|nr:hypothetical protein FSARC_1968 [Fusarium sarcochroum]